MKSSSSRLTGLAPVVGPRCRVLVLGSFPSAASLTARQYYAHPQNRFWPIIEQVTGLRLCGQPYEKRLARVVAAGIAIWDAYGACEREGSLDSAIRNAEFNDFAGLLAIAPRIRRACFNGATAARALRHLSGLGLATCVLPSTSPANASQSMELKLARWRAAMA